MTKIVIFKGLPASGKSTLAKELLEQGNTIRINKDLLREMLHCNKFTGKNESMTQEVSKDLASYFLASGINVIFDDTNLNPKTVQGWVDLAKITDSKIEYQDLTNEVDVEECIRRDSIREKKVGKSIIIKMALQYLKYWDNMDVVISDLDGTLCNLEHRVMYAGGALKDWDKFYSLLSKDTVRKDVLEKVRKTKKDKLLLVSARPEIYRVETERWLSENEIQYDLLIMREANDKREDTIVKSEIFSKYLKNLNILKVFDDRPSVVRMWKSLGLNVEDVGSGVEF